MSDEIYVNTGGSFQQPFNDRQPSNAQQPYIANAQQPYIANKQTPFTYSNRSPFTYRNPVSGQQPYIANAQQPYPYIANARSPYIANAQQPYPYIANSQNPYIASARQPFTYRNPVNGQQPYIANSQTPFTYQNRATPDAQQPSNARQPSTYQARSPFTYRNPFTYNEFTPAIGTAPFDYDVWGGGSQASAIIETTTDFQGPTPSIFTNTSVNMSPAEWWGSNSPHMNFSPNSAFAPSNPSYPSNPLASSPKQWDTFQLQNFSYSHGQCWAYFLIGFESGKVYYQYAGGNSTAYADVFGIAAYRIYLPLTDANGNNIIDNSWDIYCKYTVQNQSASGSGGTATPATGPAGYQSGSYQQIHTANSSSGSAKQFFWEAQSNSSQQNATTSANGIVFTIKASKSGQTTYYSHFIVQNSGAANGGPGGTIWLRSSYGSNRLPL